MTNETDTALELNVSRLDESEPATDAVKDARIAELEEHLASLAKWVGVPEDTPPLEIACEVSSVLESFANIKAERDEFKRLFTECHPIHLDGVQRAYKAEAERDALAAKLSARATDFLAVNIINQIGDFWSDRIPSPHWVEVRQRTNDELDAWVTGLLAGRDAEVKSAAWDECLDAIDENELNTAQAREGNPYREAARYREEGAGRSQSE